MANKRKGSHFGQTLPSSPTNIHSILFRAPLNHSTRLLVVGDKWMSAKGAPPHTTIGLAGFLP